MIENPANQKKAKLMLLTAMILFGTLGLFIRYIGEIPSSVIALIRAAVGCLFLLVFIRVRKIPLSRTALKANLKLLTVSGAFLGFNWIFLFEAFKHTSIAVAVICYYMAPVIVILASPFTLGERLTPRKVCGVFGALLGMICISGIYRTSFSAAADISGIFFGLLAACFYAAVILCNQKIKSVASYDRTIIQLFIACLALLPYTVLTEYGTPICITPFSLAILLFIGIVHTGITYVLFFSSMKDLPAQSVAIFTYLDPIVAVLLSVLFLGESLTPVGALGAFLVLGSTFFSEQE